jgi:hypothetical protein
VGSVAGIVETTEEDCNHVVATNLTGVWLCMKYGEARRIVTCLSVTLVVGWSPACGRVVSHARIIPLLLRIVPRLQREFPNVRIQLRADAGFTTPLLSEPMRSARFRAERSQIYRNNLTLHTYSRLRGCSEGSSLTTRKVA